MPQPLQTLDVGVRFIRMVHGFLLFTMVLYPVTVEKLGRSQPHDIHVICLSFLGLCPLEIGIAFFFQSRRVRPAAETLPNTAG